MTNKQISYFIIASIMSFWVGCKKEAPVEPLEDNRRITLDIDEVTCTEAWIDIKTVNIAPPFNLLIKLDSLQNQIRIFSADTTIFYDSLLAGKSYKFSVTTLDNFDGQKPLIRETPLRTLDTTSHEFSWQIFEFGDEDNNRIYDVKIISENDIWAVGVIHIKDSIGNTYPMHNLIHWNGIKWEYKRIEFFASCINPVLAVQTIQSIFRFNIGDIILGSGFQVKIISNGIESDPFCVPENRGVNAIWGKDKNDFYIVSHFGYLYHYKNGVWINIVTNIKVSLYNIWGTPDFKTIYASGSYNSNGQTALLKIENDRSEVIFNGIAQTGYFMSLWTNSNRYFYVGLSAYLAKTRNNAFIKNITRDYSDFAFEPYPIL